MKKEKICIVIQRYGLEINGGAEFHCRQLAERLVEYYDVTVLTTKSLDYIKWDNYYTKDIDEINGVHIIRCYSHRKDVEAFNEYNKKQMVGILSKNEEIQWLEKQGPFSEEIVEYIKRNKSQYKIFIFFTYLYYPTVMGIKEVYEKAILIPTAHDEAAINLSIYKDVFCKPKAIFYNTKEEKRLVESIFNNESVNNDIGGVGIEINTEINVEQFKKKYNLGRYIIYVGRIDEGKGCKTLFKYFKRYKQQNTNDLTLVLMGKNNMEIPEQNDIRYLGFVNDEDKFNGIAGAEALIIPSEFESLSIVLLEAMALETPVIVNEKSAVLREHCIRSNGGLYYNNYIEFREILNYIKNNRKILSDIARNGKKYIQEQYQWKNIIDKLDGLIKYNT